MSNYFTWDELRQMKTIEGKLLQRVIYHYWQNVAKAGEGFEFLHRLELEFSEGGKLILGTSEETEDVLALDMDFDAEKQHLLLMHEFSGKLGIRSADLSANELWAPSIGQALVVCGLVKEGESYRTDAILLDFGDEKLEVRPDVEGLIVEPFEDV
ncbi:MAG: hypothetical protein ACRC3B_23220 [Bacteroidia bacterium]